MKNRKIYHNNLILLFSFILLACSQFSVNTSLSSLIDKPDNYTNKKISVAGFAKSLPDGIYLVDSNEKQEISLSIPLSIPVKIINEVKQLANKEVVIDGVFQEHSFEDKGGELLFKPSRLLVNKIAAK